MIEENKYTLRYQNPSILIEISMTQRGNSRDILPLIEVLDRAVKEFLFAFKNGALKEILNE